MRVRALINIVRMHEGNILQRSTRMIGELFNPASLITKLKEFLLQFAPNEDLQLNNYIELLQLIDQYKNIPEAKELVRNLQLFCGNYDLPILLVLKKANLLYPNYYDAIKNRNDAASMVKIFEILSMYKILDDMVLRFFKTTKWSFNKWSHVTLFVDNKKRITLANISNSAFDFIDKIVDTIAFLQCNRIFSCIMKKINREESLVCAMQLNLMHIKYEATDLTDSHLQNIVDELCKYLNVTNFKRLSEVTLDWIKKLKLPVLLNNDLQAPLKLNQYFEAAYLSRAQHYDIIKYRK